MSLIKSNTLQLGQSLTASQNFTWYQPSTPDGTVRLGNGNAGSVTDLVTVNSSGNVGIGTSSPSERLEIYGTSNQRLKITSTSAAASAVLALSSNSKLAYVYNNDGALNVYNGDSSGPLIFSTNATERMRLDSSGNLGLGVTPSGWSGVGPGILELRGNAYIASTSQVLSLDTNCYFNGTNWVYKSSSYANRYDTVFGQHKWYNAPSGTAGNAISFTQAMTLDASGNLLVGTTTTTSITQGFYITPGAATLFDMGHASGSSSGNYYGLFRYAGTVIGSITQNGTTGVLYNTSSDQRLKENIVDAPSAIDSVNAIKVRSFDWKADGSHVDYGYIAQELLEVAPEAVHVPIDADEMMGVDFGKLTPRLVKAIQELSAELNELKAKVNA